MERVASLDHTTYKIGLMKPSYAEKLEARKTFCARILEEGEHYWRAHYKLIEVDAFGSALEIHSSCLASYHDNAVNHTLSFEHNCQLFHIVQPS